MLLVMMLPLLLHGNEPDGILDKMYKFNEIPSSAVDIHNSGLLTPLSREFVRNNLMQTQEPDFYHNDFFGIGSYQCKDFKLCFYSSFDFYTTMAYMCIVTNEDAISGLKAYPPAKLIFKQTPREAPPTIWFTLDTEDNLLTVYQIIKPTECEILVLDKYLLKKDCFKYISTETIMDLEKDFKGIRDKEWEKDYYFNKTIVTITPLPIEITTF